MPIDTFFSSLAEHQREGSIGVLLSGTAHDGTAGLKAIKTAGGLTFAQDDSALFKSMPKSAIAEGLVDKVLVSQRKLRTNLPASGAKERSLKRS